MMYIKKCRECGTLFNTNKPAKQYCQEHTGIRRDRVKDMQTRDPERQQYYRSYGRDSFINYSPFVPCL